MDVISGKSVTLNKKANWDTFKRKKPGKTSLNTK